MWGQTTTTTTTTTTPSEPHRLFLIPELLEQILLYLPLGSILQAQRVSENFKYVIVNSPTIQTALFLRPPVNSTPSEAQLQAVRDHRPSLIRLWNVESLYRETAPPGIPRSLPVNPLLVRFLRFTIAEGDTYSDPAGSGPGSGEQGTTLYGRQCLSLHPDPERVELLRKSPATASWRNMLLLPPTAAPMYEQIHLRDARCNRRLHLEPTGLTMADLVINSETHRWRRDLSGERGISQEPRWLQRMFRRENGGASARRPGTESPTWAERYSVGLQTGMGFTVDGRGVEEEEEEEREGIVEGVTGWDVLRVNARRGDDDQEEELEEEATEEAEDDDEERAGRQRTYEEEVVIGVLRFLLHVAGRGEAFSMREVDGELTEDHES